MVRWLSCAQVSLDDREQFALDHLADIEDSVKRPLDGDRWWLNADYPWQALATCHEILNAVKSGDPETCVVLPPSLLLWSLSCF